MAYAGNLSSGPAGIVVSASNEALYSLVEAFNPAVLFFASLDTLALAFWVLLLLLFRSSPLGRSVVVAVLVRVLEASVVLVEVLVVVSIGQAIVYK